MGGGARNPAGGDRQPLAGPDPAALERARTEAQVHRVLARPWSPEELRAAILEARPASKD